MESNVQRWLGGYVKIEIRRDGRERFFNLCSYKGIFPSNIRLTDGQCSCELLLKDYRSIRPLVKKTGVQVRLLDKCGLPFFVNRYRKRGGLVLGLLLALLFLYVMRLYIWSIDIEGNTYYSDEVLTDYLETIGIKNGMKSKGIVCDDVEQSLRIAFDGITWVSVEIDGTLLRVNLKENLSQRDIPEENTQTRDLVSDYDGTVLSIITRTGTPKVKAGDTVTKGQILVSGVVELHDDGDAVIGQKQVYADADVFLQTDYEMDLRVDQSYEVNATVQENRGLFLSVLGHEETFLLPVSSEYPARKETEVHQLRLFKNFYLPVFAGIVDIQYYDTEICFYDDAAFQAHCQAVLEDELENLNKKGVEIMENHVIIQSDDLCAYLRGTLTLKVQAGVSAPVALPEDIPDSSQ
jgi:similar to stage IV sporulation protein